MNNGIPPCLRAHTVENQANSNPQRIQWVRHYWARSRVDGRWHRQEFTEIQFRGMDYFCYMNGVRQDTALRKVDLWNVQGKPWGYLYALEAPVGVDPSEVASRVLYYWVRFGKTWRRRKFDERSVGTITNHVGDLEGDGLPPFVAQVYIDHWNRGSAPECSCRCSQNERFTLVQPELFEIDE